MATETGFTALTRREPLTSWITRHTGPVDVQILLNEDRSRSRAVVFASTKDAANGAAAMMADRARDPASNFGASDVGVSPASATVDGEWIAYVEWTIGGVS